MSNPHAVKDSKICQRKKQKKNVICVEKSPLLGKLKLSEKKVIKPTDFTHLQNNKKNKNKIIERLKSTNIFHVNHYLLYYMLCITSQN